MDKHWSIGVLVGLPVVVMLALAALVTIVLGLRMRARDNARRYNYGDGGILAGIGAAALLIVLVVAAWGFYPYSAQYHQWQPKTGTVTDVSSRFIGNDKGSTQKFVVEFANDPAQRYGCNDTRCSLVKEGDTLTLSCKRTWQYAGEDGWDCNYVRVDGDA